MAQQEGADSGVTAQTATEALNHVGLHLGPSFSTSLLVECLVIDKYMVRIWDKNTQLGLNINENMVTQSHGLYTQQPGKNATMSQFLYIYCNVAGDVYKCTYEAFFCEIKATFTLQAKVAQI